MLTGNPGRSVQRAVGKIALDLWREICFKDIGSETSALRQ